LPDEDEFVVENKKVFPNVDGIKIFKAYAGLRLAQG
jgi:hypothetical protein